MWRSAHDLDLAELEIYHCTHNKPIQLVALVSSRRSILAGRMVASVENWERKFCAGKYLTCSWKVVPSRAGKALPLCCYRLNTRVTTWHVLVTCIFYVPIEGMWITLSRYCRFNLMLTWQISIHFCLWLARCFFCQDNLSSFVLSQALTIVDGLYEARMTQSFPGQLRRADKRFHELARFLLC